MISLLTWKSLLDLCIEESTCHKMLIGPLKRFISMKLKFLYFFISFKHFFMLMLKV